MTELDSEISMINKLNALDTAAEEAKHVVAAVGIIKELANQGKTKDAKRFLSFLKKGSSPAELICITAEQMHPNITTQIREQVDQFGIHVEPMGQT